MAGYGRGTSGIDRCTAFFLIFAASLEAIKIPLYGLIGAQGVSFAATALDLLAVFITVYVLGGYFTVRHLIRYRIRRKKYSSIRVIYETAFMPSLTGGIVLAVICASLSKYISGIAGADLNGSLVYCALSLSVVFLSVVGIICGYIESLTNDMPTVITSCIWSVLSIVLGLIGATSAYRYGCKVAALLRNDNIAYIYGAAGLMCGMAVSCLVVLVLWLLIYHSINHTMNDWLNEQSDYRSEKESRKNIRLSVFSVFIVFLFAALFFTMPHMLDRRLSFTFSEISDHEIRSLWAVADSKVFALIYVISFLLVIPFTAYKAPLASLLIRRDRDAFSSRFGMIMRIANYLLLPVSFFCIAAAKVITALGFGIDDAAAQSVMQLSGMTVLFLSLSIILILIYAAADDMKTVLESTLFSCAVQTILFVTLISIVHMSPEKAGAIALLVFYIINTVFLLVMKNYYTLHRNRWIANTIVNALCAVIAAIPVFLLQTVLFDRIGSLASLIILIIIYYVIYIILTLFLRVADLNNIDRLPGGRIIVTLADLFNL